MSKNKKVDSDSDSFGERLYFAMRLNGMSQKELAMKIGVSEKTVWRYVNNYYIPNGEIVNRISDALHVNTDFLLGRIKSKFPEESAYYEMRGILRKNLKKWSEKQILELINMLRSAL